MPTSCKAQTADFYCSKTNVWHILTSCDSYKDWYGFPETLDLIEASPDFSLGSKLIFRDDRLTHVVTEFDLNSRLAISTANETNEFTISDAEYGCRVMLVTTLTTANASFNGTEQAHEQSNREVLKQLKAAAYAYEEKLPGHKISDETAAKDASVTNVLFSLMQGYKSPTEKRDDDKSEQAKDETEQDVRFSLKASVVALALAVLLFTTLSFSFGFERSDIVPSSGLSIMENENVNKENTTKIYIGQTKTELELMLSCTGYRLSPDEYCYSSSEKDEKGNPDERIFVIYDSYGKVRRFGYVNYVECDVAFGGEVIRYNRQLSPSMDAIQTEEIIAEPCSAFTVDKSGLTTVYFGVLNVNEGIFSVQQKSELVIKLNSKSQQIDAQFYYPFDRLNPLSTNELTKDLKRQYSNMSLYLADKLSFERAFLIQGKTAEQVDIILDTKDMSEVEIKDGTMIIYKKYVLIDDVQNDRYKYAANYFNGGEAQEISFENLVLGKKSDMLTDYREYGLNLGMTRYEVYRAIGAMPSAVYLNSKTVTISYGQKIGDFTNPRYNYDLVLSFDAENDALKEITVNY